jgi:hypothetical protein
MAEQKVLRIFAMKDNIVDGKEWTLWIGVDTSERYPPAYPIGNRVRYSPQEAIDEAKQIAEEFGIPNDAEPSIKKALALQDEVD